jgi:hypothetical protein
MRGIPIGVERIDHESVDIIEFEGCQHNLSHPRSRFADCLHRPHERVRRTDLVVAVGPD